MSEWAVKRFWKAASVEATGDGFAILLDGRAIRTPAKTGLVVPTRAMAEAIAEEWQAQEGKIDPMSMPLTRSANAAIDKVTGQFDEVADMLAAYGETDHLCYRATGPEALIARQAEAWDPLLQWVETRFDAPLKRVSGVVHMAQPEPSLARLRAEVHALDPFEMAAMHDLVCLSGSLLIGLAAIHGIRPIEELWQMSRIDEIWQEEQWGRDEEASDLAESKRRAFLHADRFYRLAQPERPS